MCIGQQSFHMLRCFLMALRKRLKNTKDVSMPCCFTCNEAIINILINASNYFSFKKGLLMDCSVHITEHHQRYHRLRTTALRAIGTIYSNAGISLLYDCKIASCDIWWSNRGITC